MSLSRRGFLFGSAAAIVAAAPVVRAVAAVDPPVIYGGTIGRYEGIRFTGKLTGKKIFRPRTRPSVLAAQKRADDFFGLSAPPSLWRYLAAA
jgi:hypothetical protein